MTEPAPKLWRGKPTPKLRLDVYRKSDYCCTRCGLRFVPPVDYDGRQALWCDGLNRRNRPVLWLLELDHIIPYHLGGRYVRENLQALCTRCNSIKGART
jgi:5-methylcytosine-specific restriction endonuclease McrA